MFIHSNILGLLGWLFGSLYGHCSRWAHQEAWRNIGRETAGFSPTASMSSFLSCCRLMTAIIRVYYNIAFLMLRQSLLDLALRTTAAAADPCHEDLTCCVVGKFKSFCGTCADSPIIAHLGMAHWNLLLSLLNFFFFFSCLSIFYRSGRGFHYRNLKGCCDKKFSNQIIC